MSEAMEGRSGSVLTALVGEKLTEIGRALDMGIFSFGPNVPWVSVFGKSETRARFALHVQCKFRMSRKMQPLLEDADINRILPDTEAVELRRAGWSVDDQPTIFDAKAYSLRPVLRAEEPTVRSVNPSSDGKLSISLSGDVLIQVAPPVPAEEEAWRLFDRIGGHVVFP
jgi:hypothetical protein